jgi:dihydrofolate synthase/folylpolyglutamate synthase
MRLCDEHKIKATYFELTTALAFLTYKQSQCDAVVLEVGLGGRDDATNVIQNPSLSIITSIQLDHTKVLQIHLLQTNYLSIINMHLNSDSRC